MARDAILATAYLLWGASNDQTAAAVATIWSEVNDMVTAFYDIHIMLYHHNGVATAYESIKGGEQFLDVVEVEPRGWLVEDEHGGSLLLLTDEVGQFYTLVLASREGRGVLSELYITQSHVLQWLQSFHDLWLVMLGKEQNGIVDGHAQNVVYILSFKSYIEDV